MESTEVWGWGAVSGDLLSKGSFAVALFQLLERPLPLDPPRGDGPHCSQPPLPPAGVASHLPLPGRSTRSGGEYQADEQAGVTRLRWRVSGR